LPQNSRTRLDPDVRRSLILDAAAQLVTSEGVSAVSMERVGREAGVSKALVYNYYASRNQLLSALLERETRDYRQAQRKGAEAATDVASLVRVTTRAYLDHVAEKGVLIERLMSEPSLADALHESDVEARDQTVAFLASRLNADGHMPNEIALMLVDLTLGLTGAGGAYLDRTGCSIDLLEDMLVTMILSNIRAAREGHTRWRLP
jgi:TetR/AcrR family transcriptional regulator, fatty acid biosynthesis regulator